MIIYILSQIKSVERILCLIIQKKNAYQDFIINAYQTSIRSFRYYTYYCKVQEYFYYFPSCPSRSTTFTSSLPVFLSAHRAISCRNAGIREENWYPSHVKSIIATANSPSVLRYRIPRHQRSYLSTSRMRSSLCELSPWMLIFFHQHRALALIVARLYFLYPAGLLRSNTVQL